MGLLALTSCNCEGTTRESDASALQSAGGSNAESAFAEAGQAALSPEELDRLLDALEAELERQENTSR